MDVSPVSLKDLTVRYNLSMNIDMNQIRPVTAGGKHNKRNKLYGLTLDTMVVDKLKEVHPGINMSATVRNILSALLCKLEQEQDQGLPF